VPDRIVRAGILDSDRVDQLDPPSEVFYRRLMSIVDDHGLFDARPSLLKSKCFPIRPTVRETDIPRWLAACEKAGLLALYTVNGKPFGKMLDTKWPVRSEPKYPLPTLADNCLQPSTNASVVVDVVVGVVGVEGSPSAPPAAKDDAQGKRLPKDWALPDDWRAWALAERPGINVAEEAAKFADYWHGIAGAKGRKADWLATWRNWIRNSRGPAGNGSQVSAVASNPDGVSPRLSPTEEKRRQREALAEMERQMREFGR
jgi:hypothetical protein